MKETPHLLLLLCFQKPVKPWLIATLDSGFVQVWSKPDDPLPLLTKLSDGKSCKATSCDRHQALLFGPACPGSSHTKRSRARHFHRLAFYRKTYLSSHRYNFVDGGT
ncbi:hypothetical protein V6N11_072818 [Hibiscus sabdariffa]|uniref:Uncharacterized protein n=1 Tax=Hibiscus sabdariffa TaxID=183260 RepID=A0ABR2A707_9ROSI